MGIRVEFWEIPKADIKKAIINDFNELRDWYDSIGEESPEDIDYNLLEDLGNVTNKEKLFEQLNKDLIDELVCLYIGEYCDYGPGKIHGIENTSFLYVKHYLNNQKKINQLCTLATQRLWNFIINGRSVSDPNSLLISDEIFKFCFLTEPECQVIYYELINNFDVSKPDGFNKHCGIGSFIDAIKYKKNAGVLITVA